MLFITPVYRAVKRYELIDHTADLMVKAHGKTLEECFSNAGYALFDQTVDLSTVKPTNTYIIEIRGDHDEDRLYSFLSELLFLEDCEGLVLCDFNVKFIDDSVQCTAKGEVLDRSIHRVRSEIKAVTYHMMNIDRTEPSVTVIFDV